MPKTSSDSKYKTPVTKRSGIGSIQDNRIRDFDFSAKALQMNIEIRNLGKAGKPKTKEELEQRIDAFFAICQAYALPATVEGLALATSYDRRSLFRMEQGDFNLPFVDTIRQAKEFIASFDAILAQSNKLNAAIYCFRAKNMYGMRDVQEIQATAAYNTDPEPEKVEEILEALPGIEEKNENTNE